MIGQIVAILLYPIYSYLIIFTFNFNYIGAMISRTIFEIIALIGISIYLYFDYESRKCLFIPKSFDVLKGWTDYLKIAIPAMLMGALELWAFEIINLLCGIIGVTDLAANSVSYNLALVLYLASVGIGLGTGTFVGNSIGAKNIADAKIFIKIGILLTTCVYAIMSVLLIIFKRVFIDLYANSDDPQIQNLMKIMIWLIILLELFDSLQATCGKILTGMGKQSYASVVNLIVYYGIMIPGAAFIGYYLKFGVIGVWIIIVISVLIIAGAYFIGVYKSDFIEEYENCN